MVPKGTASLIGVVAAEELELLTIRYENIYSTGAKAFRRCRLDRSQFLEKYPQVFKRELGCLKGDLHLELRPVSPTHHAMLCETSARGYQRAVEGRIDSFGVSRCDCAGNCADRLGITNRNCAQTKW